MYNFGKKKEMSPAEKKAKLAALGEANGMASKMMKDGLSGLKKVTVASDSKEGLKKGLDKAEELVKGENPFGKSASPFQNDEEEATETEDSSSEEEYEDAADDMMAECDTEEEIDDMIAKLQEKKKQLQS